MTINKISSADSIKDVLCAIDEFCQEQLSRENDETCLRLKEEILESDKDMDFITLMTICLNRFFDSWQRGIRFYGSFESFKNDAISNEVYFDVETYKIKSLTE